MSGKPAGNPGECDISGSNGRCIQLRAARGANKAKRKRVGFTRERKESFLSFFAATANADASARAAGVAKSTVHEHRRKDPQFRAAWDEALIEGYARVEALSVRWAEQALTIRPNSSAAKTARDMDPKVALAVLEAYRRNRGARPGDILPRRSDIEQVRARIEKTMRALGLIGDEEAPSTATRSPSPGNPGEDEEAPSTATRSPSPGNPGEDDGGAGDPSTIRPSADGPPPHRDRDREERREER